MSTWMFSKIDEQQRKKKQEENKKIFDEINDYLVWNIALFFYEISRNLIVKCQSVSVTMWDNMQFADVQENIQIWEFHFSIHLISNSRFWQCLIKN